MKWFRLKLMAQANLLFTVVSLISMSILLIFVGKSIKDMRVTQDRIQQREYLNEVIREVRYSTTPVSRRLENEYNGVIIFYPTMNITHNIDILSSTNYTVSNLKARYYTGLPQPVINESGRHNIYFIGEVIQTDNGTQVLVLTFSNGQYQNTAVRDLDTAVRIGFAAIVILGNIIIFIWSTIIVERIKKLNVAVGEMALHNYEKEINDTGSDEITELSETINDMRKSIYENEETKKEMMQNISHDFKTPISVIKSYAEAIMDGVSTKEEAAIIVKQADLMNQKVKQLITYNKLTYFQDPNTYQMIQLKPILENVKANFKYNDNVKVTIKLDHSEYLGTEEMYYTIFNNILDNAVRYAQTTIDIKLKNKKLTIYNDGEPIHERFIKDGFKAYEKGDKGQFGLGMSIVQKACQHFGLRLSVENIHNGVMFTIEPI